MADDEACPSCGAIYSRVEAYLKAAQARPASSRRAGMAAQDSRFPPSRTSARLVDPDFVATMRDESLYPTFRGLVKIGQWLFYLLAVALVIGGFNAGDTRATIAALFGAALLVVIATAAKEAALMMADVSDAAVIRAARAGSDN